MKLLFDQNLSPRLPRELADIYPASLHVRDRGMRDAEDAVIWAFARKNDFVILSRDTDFQQRSLLHGQPRFVWLRIGNGPTDAVKRLLRDHAVAIHDFVNKREESHLILPLEPSGPA